MRRLSVEKRKPQPLGYGQWTSLLMNSSILKLFLFGASNGPFAYQEKTPFSLVARMGSAVDNPARHIASSSEGSWADPLQSRIPPLLGYPLMGYIALCMKIIAFLEPIVKSNRTYEQCPCLFTCRTARFFLSSCPKSSNNEDLGGVSDVRKLISICRGQD